MRSNIVALGLAIVLAWQGTTFAQSASLKLVTDPDRFSADLVQTVAKGDLKAASTTVADTTGQPSMVQNLQSAMQVFEGKKFDFVRKVLDKQFEGSLRQIIHYAFVENLGFVYFRFNFKMTSKGWVLAHYMFKNETQDLFPREFLDP